MRRNSPDVNGKNELLTFEQLANISDKEWKWSFYESVYNFYPLSMPINETLNRVPSDSLLIEGKTTFMSSSVLTGSPKVAIN